MHEISGYLYTYCTVCMEHIGESYPATEQEAHQFNDAGDCPLCSYKAGCTHEQIRFVTVNGFPAYHQEDDETHIYEEKFREECVICGAVIRQLAEDQYEDDLTTLLTLQDLESVNWAQNSLYAMERVVINNLKVDNDHIEFEAFNAGMLVYAVVSYNKDGKEIDRQYIDAYDATASMLENAGRTFWATGRIFDVKVGNEADTKQTNIRLRIEPGGYVMILQPNQDFDLLVTNCVEAIFRMLDIIDSTADLKGSPDLADAAQLTEALGKKEFLEIMKNLLIRKGADITFENFEDLSRDYFFKEFFSSSDWVDLFAGELSVDIFDKAKELGIEVAVGASKCFEDIVMLSLGGTTGGATIAIMEFLKGAQVALDLSEMQSLSNDFTRCMNGEDLVRTQAILIPEDDYSTRVHRDIIQSEVHYATPSGITIVRSGPTIRLPMLGTAKPTETYEILDFVPSADARNASDWYKIRYYGMEGYIPVNVVYIQTGLN